MLSHKVLTHPTVAARRYPRRALVADDLRSCSAILVRLLQRRGINADCVDDGLDAWLALNRRHFDIVITDIEMPVWSGTDLVHAMRNSGDEQIRSTPILVCSSLASKQIVDCVHSYQATYYIRKPVTAANLDALLRMIATVSESAAAYT